MELKSKCEQAPYGRREETIVDTSVRNAWQLDASRLTIGPAIKKAVTALIPQLSTDLGCQGVKIKALPYKLVLYEKGGFFLPHRDTEKAPGMFATLVIQLPAEHKGGELVVQHNGEEKVFNFATKSAAKIFFAAFFADCMHELRPVTSGLRLCLIYNLLHTGIEPTPPADCRQAVDRIVQAVNGWIADEGAPTKLICVLQHQYTQAGLSFNGLKNRDRAVAEVLRMAAKESALDIHLAILTKRDTGSAEENYGRSYKKRCGYQNPKHWSMSDDFESTVTLNNWVGPDDQSKDLGEMFVDEESEFLAENPFDNLKPDGIEVEECSGNEGASMERWYNLAAIAIWPSANKLALKLDARSQYGMDNAVRNLQEDIAVCREKGLAARSKEWQECQEMTQLMVKRFKKPLACCYMRGGTNAIMLSNIQSCGDLQLYTSYLEVVTKESFSAEIASSLLQGCKHYGWPALHDSLCAMLQHSTKNSKVLSECVSLVAALASEGGPTVITDEQQLRTCRELAAVVYAAVIACSTEAVPVSALFKMLYVIDQPQLLQEAVRHVKTRPEQYQVMDQPLHAAWYYTSQPVRERSVVAAVHELSSWLGAKAQECAPFVELLKVCITVLTAKAFTAIPDTWAVKFSFTPCCKDCRDLAQFLSSSSQEVGRFKVGARHSHLLQKLVGVNASSKFEHKSQTLVVTKTRPQLQRQRDQQAKYLQALANLRALPAAVRITSTTNGSAATPTASHLL